MLRPVAGYRGLRPAWRWLDNAPPADHPFEQALIGPAKAGAGPDASAIIEAREAAVEAALARLRREQAAGRTSRRDRRRRLRLFARELEQLRATEHTTGQAA